MEGWRLSTSESGTEERGSREFGRPQAKGMPNSRRLVGVGSTTQGQRVYHGTRYWHGQRPLGAVYGRIMGPLCGDRLKCLTASSSDRVEAKGRRAFSSKWYGYKPSPIPTDRGRRTSSKTETEIPLDGQTIKKGLKTPSEFSRLPALVDPSVQSVPPHLRGNRNPNRTRHSTPIFPVDASMWRGRGT